MRIASGGPTDWGAQIRRYRSVHGLKQVDVAEAVGVDQATVSRWECGLTIPDRPMQRRLTALMHRTLADESLLKHSFAVSLSQIMLLDAERIIRAASASYSAAHGVAQGEIVGMSTWPMLTEEADRLWQAARERGFLHGDVASVTAVAHSHSLTGHIRNRTAKVVWTPIRTAGGEIFRRVERRDLTEEEYAREESSGAIRIVTVDDLLH